MSIRLPGSAFAPLLLALACATPIKVERYQAFAAGPAKADTADDLPACEVSLELKHTGEKSDQPFIASEKACIKRAGSPMALPGQIRLLMVDWFYIKRVCENETAKAHEDGTAECIWNRNFRDEWPFDFTITSAKQPLSRYLQLVRVYRNGSLIYSWDGTSDPKPSEDSEEQRTLSIPGRRLTARLMPHLADFDLRVVPVDVTVDDAVRSAQTVNYTDPLKRQLTLAFGSVRDGLLAEPAVKARWTCFQAQMQQLAHLASTLPGRATEIASPVAPPDGCALPKLTTTGGQTLSDLYDQLKLRSIDSADELDRKVEEAVGTTARKIGVDGSRLLDEFKQRPEIRELGSRGATLLKDADDLFLGVTQLADQTLALHAELKKSAIRIGSDRKEQAKLFQATHEALAEKELFESRAANPTPFVGELSLDMRYDDRFQYYVLAPWNGVPVRTSGSNPGASSLGWENAIPIVDALGARYQWAASRFADVRLAVGGMLISDELKPLDPAGAPMMNAENKKVFNWAVQGNLNIGGLRVGVAYVTSNQDNLIRSNSDRWRVLVGADLLKLLTGTNIEAFAF
jgi:hypothetical protein